MQRILPLVLVALLAVTSNQAQTLTDIGNTPIIGTSQPSWTADFQDPGASGAGVVWNFSALTSATAVTYGCVDPAESAWAATFPSAAYALTNSVTDTLFYTSTSNGLELVGEDVTYITFDVQVPFTDNMLALKLPCSLGTNWTDNIGATYEIDGVGTTTRTGSFTGNADATGTLQLPGGVEVASVLRVHTRLQQFDDAGLTTATHDRDEWAWYTQWSKFPVMRTVADTINVSFPPINQVTRTTEWLDSAFVGMHDMQRDAFGLEVFPNPTGGSVTLTFGAFDRKDMVLTLTDGLGRTVLSERLGDPATGFHQHVLDMSGLPAGFYSVRLSDASGAQSVIRVVRD